MYHPWRRLRELPAWELSWANLPVSVVGLTDWATRTVTLERDQTQAERRSAIAHELEHIERGPAPAG